MKKVLFSITVVASLATLFVACKSNPLSTLPVLNSDTAGLTQFNEWKAMEAQAVVAKQNQAAYDAGRNAAGRNNAVAAKTYSRTSETTNEAKVAKKKGWSKSAKYGVLGAAGGGILGAVINKKDPVRGAVVGAVVLGGGGYIFGRSQDKKDGRF